MTASGCPRNRGKIPAGSRCSPPAAEPGRYADEMGGSVVLREGWSADHVSDSWIVGTSSEAWPVSS
jgi:hypothetical protein